MSNQRQNVLILILLIFSTPVFAQSGNFRVAFYNVENLFDTEDNPVKNDNEFLPEGSRRWTKGRYWNKQNNLARIISSIGEWSYPAVVGLCEVENENVLKDLTIHSPLKKAAYRFVVTDSPDQRGINTALLYQRDQFKYLSHSAFSINFPANKNKKTRDVLHVSGEVVSGDTLDIFVCHFPSRRGGAEASEPDRMFVAGVVKLKTDSIFSIRKNPNILIMGDFNDQPSNKSIAEILKAKPPIANNANKALYNLFSRYEKMKNEGSYKFGREWNMLDQIIVSGNLLNQSNPRFQALPHTAVIFRRDFMTTNDKTHAGKRPKKTFHGYKHEGGFSDHFPVYVDLRIK